jgi:S1-C subfamily serine protease
MLILLALLAPSAAGQEPQGLTPIEARTTPEVRVVREASPAVVYIEVVRSVTSLELGRGLQYGTQTTTGSGAVLDSSGLVITNFHVIGRDVRRITVQFDPDLDLTVYEAQVVSVAPTEDLALLKIDGERDFPELRQGKSSDLMIGERVIAIGNPLRQRLSVSSGIISGLHRNVTFEGGFSFSDLIQTDAAINPGNSGGPLLNVLGELVGINTAVNEGAQNMGFAIPVDRVKEVLSEVLLAPGSARAWFGMEVDETGDFKVLGLVAGGPADLGGVRLGDRLVKFDKTAVVDCDSYRLSLVAVLPEQPVELAFERALGDGEPQRFTVLLQGWTRWKGALHQHLGITADQALVNLFPHVQVENVAPGGPAAALGMRPGDVLDSIRIESGKAWIADSPRSLATLVAALGPGAELTIDLWRDADGNRGFSDDERLRGSLRLR